MLRRLSALIAIEAKYIAAKNALKQQGLNLVVKQRLVINLPPGASVSMQPVKSVTECVKKKK
jgi:hypothetical protein